ncbi:MAG: hypothetical protein ACPGF7_06155 [Pontibacterium sp.]
MQNEILIRTNNQGEPDLDFYRQEACAMRHQAISEGATRASQWLKNQVTRLPKFTFKYQGTYRSLLGH